MKVFISHSSQEDPFAVEVCNSVKKQLQSYDVLVDMDALQPGDDWSCVIYHWLAECHAAVILLNRKALSSPWVQREINVLLWRRALGAPLRIVPAILGDLTAEEVEKAGFSELKQLQFAQLAPDTRTETAACELGAKIAQRFAGHEAVIDNSPMGEWTNVVATYLRQVKDLDSLVEAARELGVDDDHLSKIMLPTEGCRFLASQMLARVPNRRLYHAISRIDRYTPLEWLSRLIDQISPSWVDGEAARSLLARREERRTVALNARLTLTAKHYVLRATCCASSGYQDAAVSAVTGEAFFDEFKAECQKAVRSLLKVPNGFDLDAALPSPGEEPEETAFLVVDPAKTPMTLVAAGIREVQNDFPWLTVVLLTGDAAPQTSELADWQMKDAIVLSPHLGPGEELTGQQMVRSLDGLRKNLIGRDIVA